VSTQRARHKDGQIGTEQKARLDELGFVWNIKDVAWETKFSELRRYWAQFGDCNVPDEWRENPRLGKWVQNQRAQHKAGKLSPTRRVRLDELGFVWDIKDAAGETRFSELERYWNRFGNTNVPSVWDESPQLSKWVRNQRALQSAGKLSSARKAPR